MTYTNKPPGAWATEYEEHNELMQKIRSENFSKHQQIDIENQSRRCCSVILNSLIRLQLQSDKDSEVELDSLDDVDGLAAVVLDNINANPYSVDPQLKILLQEHMKFRRLIIDNGGAIKGSETATLLGLSSDALRKRRYRGNLFAFKANSNWYYPSAQFDNRGRIYPGIKEIGTLIKDVDPKTRVSFLFSIQAIDNTDDGLKETKQIMDLIRDGQVDIVRRHAVELKKEIAI